MKPKKMPMKEAKTGNEQKLRNRIRYLERKVKALEKEKRAFESAFKHTKSFLRDHTEEISLEKLIEAAKKGQSLKDAKDDSKLKSCEKCGGCDLRHIGKLILCMSCNGSAKYEDDKENI